MRFHTLSEWLRWQETLHFTDIDPGLERIGEVWKRMGGTHRLPFKVVTVAGTNGKGSSVALLESILRQGGYRTASYTSPHILRYNERICLHGQPVSDELICEAFHIIDECRQSVSLTYFEFATLAAAYIFCQQQVDIAMLEVGMGGRLDAVNIFDTDIALITPISLDHTQWLGSTREQIGREKAGIMTAGNPVVCSEQPPDSVLALASQKASPVFQAGMDFHWQHHTTYWDWSSSDITLEQLPLPALEGQYQVQNAAAVLQVLMLFNQQGLAVTRKQIESGLRQVRLAGRFQRIKGEIETILDVTHNEQGARNLAAMLAQNPVSGRTFAVVGMLRDKEMAAVATIMAAQIDGWFVGTLSGARGQAAADLYQSIVSAGIDGSRIITAEDIASAYQQAVQAASGEDRIIVFGSFHTVEAVLKVLDSSAAKT